MNLLFPKRILNNTMTIAQLWKSSSLTQTENWSCWPNFIQKHYPCVTHARTRCIDFNPFGAKITAAFKLKPAYHNSHWTSLKWKPLQPSALWLQDAIYSTKIKVRLFAIHGFFVTIFSWSLYYYGKSKWIGEILVSRTKCTNVALIFTATQACLRNSRNFNALL